MWQLILTFLYNHTPLLYWTQSLWRDEAFSVWIAQESFNEVIKRTSADYNPPLYYLLLKLWLMIFGKSEITLRSLSLVSFIIFLFVVYLFSHRLFRNRKLAVIMTILAATNPMLLYFAFELRMYALLTLFTILSMYHFLFNQWRWYVIFTTLGLYTQPFMVFILLAQTVYLIFTKHFRRVFKNLLFIGLLYLPWLPTLFAQFKASGPMWMYSVDLNLILSVLANLYVGYEGTPPNLWLFMYLISLSFIFISYSLWKEKKIRRELLLILLWVYLPVVFIITISFIKPIYVHRYVIYTTVGEVFLVGYFIHQIRKLRVRHVIAVSLILFNLGFTIYFAPYHKKVDIRSTFMQMQSFMKPTDVVYSATPLVFFESLYYAPSGTPIYLYNPYDIEPPRYVGVAAMPKKIWRSDYPLLPERAFVVYENGLFEIKSKNHL